MANNDPSSPTAGPDEPASADDAVRRLQERLDRASARAEQLIGEAADARKPPPAGWQEPGGERDPATPGDLELLTQLVQSVRELIPADLERRLAEALRELLMAVRALIDFYLERLERRSPEPAEVEDIPIT